MITEKSVKELSANNYVRKASHLTNYWFDFTKGKLDTYLKKGNKFNIIIYSKLNVDDFYYVIPFSILEDVFKEQYYSLDNRRRWIGNIYDHKLKITTHSGFIDIKEYYRFPLDI